MRPAVQRPAQQLTTSRLNWEAGLARWGAAVARPRRLCCSSPPSEPLLAEQQQVHQKASEIGNDGDSVDWSRYRRAVGVCIVNPQTGLVFGAQRADSGCDTWQMVQGGIDEGEDVEAAALRELAEETSIRSARIVAKASGWLTYDHPPHVKSRLPPDWGHLRGQAQRWLLVEFTGEDDTEINLDTACPEFSRWQWMPLEDLPAAVVPFKRDVYEQVVREFGPLVAAYRRRKA